ncbi:hypothetical protein [Burkholderia thailandensis]|uniref:hypothetical protein n=1 Tax=Burkholderia thailandensis TaxID=57975 RepID=UPI000A80EF82|nr:hypothetical protein [Burkholderia thailandensis]
MLPISATASQRSMPFALSRYFPDFRDSAIPRFRVVSAGPADQRSAILETIIFRMRYPTTPHFGFFSVDAIRSLSLFNASIYRPYRFGPYIHTDHEFLNSFDFGARERILPPIHQNQWY